jgi:predicted dehydrogenase
MVVSPPQSHVAVAGAVLEAGKPLICEKPVTLNSADVARLDSLARKRSIPVAIDHEFRYDPAMILLRDLLRSGAIGKVRASALSAVATFGVDPQSTATRYWDFFHSLTLGGGMMPQFASHLLDLHVYMFGGMEARGGYLPILVDEKPTRPATPGGPDGPMRAVEAEDTGALAARLPDGGAASLSLTYVATCMPDLRWIIHGEEGALLYEGKNGWFDGTLSIARGWNGAREVVPVTPRPRLEQAPDMLGWMQDLISALLLDFAAVVGGQSKEGRFATLADEAQVWGLIESWRAQHRA